jgi:hypothetical protein
VMLVNDAFSGAEMVGCSAQAAASKSIETSGRWTVLVRMAVTSTEE